MFSNNGFTQLAVSGSITIVASPASISLNGQPPPDNVSVIAGSHVSVGVSDGPANAGDWVGLFSGGAQDGQFLAWKYLNGSASLPDSGVPRADLSFAVPVSAGSYEFRFFSANGFIRLATSTAMVVSTSAAHLTVNGVSAPATTPANVGTIAVVSASDGPANPGDWVALFAEGAADAAFIDWRYLNDTAALPGAGSSAGTLHFLLPATPGPYEFRFFADSGFGRLATSGPVTVLPSPAQIEVEGVLPPLSIQTQPGATIEFHVSSGPGNPTDWVALADKTSPSGTYAAWQYLNGSTIAPSQGVSSATLTFVMPPATGHVRSQALRERWVQQNRNQRDSHLEQHAA